MKVFISPPFRHLRQFGRGEVWVAFVVADGTGSSLPPFASCDAQFGQDLDSPLVLISFTIPVIKNILAKATLREKALISLKIPGPSLQGR